MDELKYLTEFYSAYNEDGRLTSRHGQVEFLTTMRYIGKYLQKGMRILEVGVGTGRYSLALAESGICVDAVELIQHNIDILSAGLTENHALTVRQGNAIDLSFFMDNVFDITLVRGPLYHLFDIKDKKRQLKKPCALRSRAALYLLLTAWTMPQSFNGASGVAISLMRLAMASLKGIHTNAYPTHLCFLSCIAKRKSITLCRDTMSSDFTL